MKELKVFLVFVLVLLLGLWPSYSEEKYWLTETEYNQIIENMMTAQKELSTLKLNQKKELNELKMQLQTQSKFYKEQEKEQKKKTVLYSIVGFSAGVVFASGVYVFSK